MEAKRLKKRSGKQCAVYGCSSAFYLQRNLHFFHFPREKHLRKRWCNLIKRQDGHVGFKVTQSTVICSEHFKAKDIRKTLTGMWKLKQGAEPSMFSWNSLNDANKPRKPPKIREDLFNKNTSSSTKSTRKTMEDITPCCEKEQVTTSDIDAPQEEVITRLNREIELLKKEQECLKTKLEELNNECLYHKSRYFSLDKIKEDDQAVSFYTGFPNYKTLIAFYYYLEPKVQNLQYWKGEKGFKETTVYQEEKDTKKSGPARKLDPLNEFFLVLVRLRVGLFIYDIADRFGISVGLVSKICNTWIIFLYYELKLIFPFPNQGLIRKNMPKEFIKYSTTRIILDCTEIFSEKPSAMLAQSQTWSQYKHHNTWKVLVGISPNGQVTFISEAWSGKVSDKQITQDSGVLEFLEPGDNVMADKGFEIEDIVPPGVRVNMPPFLQSRSQFSAANTEKTMNIASVRIHVERAIQRIKTFHILDGIVPLTLAPHITQVFTVCALLTNFWPPLLPPADEDNHLKLA